MDDVMFSAAIHYKEWAANFLVKHTENKFLLLWKIEFLASSSLMQKELHIFMPLSYSVSRVLLQTVTFRSFPSLLQRWHLWFHTWRNFTHCCWMPAIPLVAVWTLDKDGAITQALSKHFASDVVESNSSSWNHERETIQLIKYNKHKICQYERSGTHYESHSRCLQMIHSCKVIPMCLRVISTVAFLLTLDSRPRQKRSEFDGSVNPSTVSEGCEAWNVSPTRWFSS